MLCAVPGMDGQSEESLKISVIAREETIMKKLVLVLLLTLASVSIASADTIYLRGGTTLRGNVLGFINGRFAVQLTAGATLPVDRKSVV